MKPAAWRLVLTAALFLGWVGYLACLAFLTRNQVVLSRPQFLVSGLDVVAVRQEGDAFVVQDVLWPADKKGEWDGKTVVIQNLDLCQTYSKDGWQTVPPPVGQRVLLPLRTAAADTESEGRRKAEVVPIPASPGFPPPDPHHAGPALGPPRIYPADAATLSQYRTIPKP